MDSVTSSSEEQALVWSALKQMVRPVDHPTMLSPRDMDLHTWLWNGQPMKFPSPYLVVSFRSHTLNGVMIPNPTTLSSFHIVDIANQELSGCLPYLNNNNPSIILDCRNVTRSLRCILHFNSYDIQLDPSSSSTFMGFHQREWNTLGLQTRTRWFLTLETDRANRSQLFIPNCRSWISTYFYAHFYRDHHFGWWFHSEWSPDMVSFLCLEVWLVEHQPPVPVL